MRETGSGAQSDGAIRDNGDADPPEVNAVTTSAADVESAGRSCLAIVALAVIILVLLLLWIVIRSTAGG